MQELIDDFIRRYHHYPNWKSLEKDLRALFNETLAIKAVEITPFDPTHHETLANANTWYHFNKDDPFPIKLIHRSMHQVPMAITRIGQKKDKTSWSEAEINQFETLHRYLEQQLQYAVERDRLTKNLNHQTKQFQAARTELDEMGRVKDNFLSIASHELRTPMSVIRGYADFLLTEDFGTLNDQQKNFLQKILSNAKLLTKLVNDMLDIHKLEAGKMDFQISEVNLSELVGEVTKDHRILLREKQQELTFTDQSSRPTLIQSDPEKIKLVLANLISNAYKFTPEKGTITVTLAPQTEGEHWQVSVSDTGVGVNDENKAQLFEKFQQVDNSFQKKHAGTGLGLSICREIISQLGGEIWVTDNDPAGAQFHFTLPA